LTSNIAESLNAFLDRAREMSVFPMMEFIRGELMRWFNERSVNGAEERGIVVKSVSKAIEVSLKNRARHYTARKSTNTLWEVISQANVDEELRRRYIINLKEHTCDCHRWQASGIPCAHALAILLHLRKDPFQYVEPCFHSHAYQQTYASPIFPIPDHIEWMPTESPDTDNSDDEDHSRDSEDDVPFPTLPPNTR
jgi:hypothetical protein